VGDVEHQSGRPFAPGILDQHLAEALFAEADEFLSKRLSECLPVKRGELHQSRRQSPEKLMVIQGVRRARIGIESGLANIFDTCGQIRNVELSHVADPLVFERECGTTALNGSLPECIPELCLTGSGQVMK
jgi:hypothetical protein